MTEMYGHKFTSAYGEAPNETWAMALAGVTHQEIIAAMKQCFKREDTWPPTLPEFLKLCRPQKPVLPKNNHELPFFASEHGLPPARSGESYNEYRARLKSVLATIDDSGVTMLTRSAQNQLAEK